MELNVVIVDDNEMLMRVPAKMLDRMESPMIGDEKIELKIHPLVAHRKKDGLIDIESLASEISRLEPGVALIDMRLEGDEVDDLSGVDLSLRVRALCPDCCIILVSTYFAQTPQKEVFAHLEIFRSLVGRGTELSARKYEDLLKSKVTEAALTYVSTINYRRFRFTRNVNGGKQSMWGLVLNPDRKGENGKAQLTFAKNLPIPILGSNSVVVKLIEVGVCGTDRMSLGMGSPPDFSLIDFHEAFGQVVWTGEDVRNIKVRDYVVPMVRRCDPWDPPDKGSDIKPSSFGFHRCDDASYSVCYPRADRCPIGEYQSSSDGIRRGYKSRGTGKCHGFGSQFFVDTEKWLIRVDPPGPKSFSDRMKKRYVLTEPLSVVWKAHREIIKHRSMREFSDRALIIGLGPIGLLAATVMQKLHPGLNYTAMDLAEEDNERVKILQNHLPDFKFFQALENAVLPAGLEQEKFDLIIDATDQPNKVFEYAPSLLTPGGILVLLGISDEQKIENITAIITDLVKRGNILIGSINSSRSDFKDSIAFMERVIGDYDSILDDVTHHPKGMVTRMPIDNDLPEKLTVVGQSKPWKRDEIKIVLEVPLAEKYDT